MSRRGVGKVRYQPAEIAPRLAVFLALDHRETLPFLEEHPELLESYDVAKAAGGDLTPGQWLNRGLLHLIREERHDARTAFETARHSADPDVKGAAFYGLGLALQEEDPDGALAAFQRSVDVDSVQSPNAAVSAAELAAGTDPHRAIGLLRYARDRHGPHQGGVAVNLALLQDQVGDRDAAMDTLRWAVEHADPENRAIAALNLANRLDLEEAAPLYVQAAQGPSPEVAARALVQLGITAAEAGQIALALDAYRAATEVPVPEQRARALTNIGELLLTQERFEEAVAALEEAAEQEHPWHAWRARVALGSALAGVNRFGEARAVWESCLKAPFPRVVELAQLGLSRLADGWYGTSEEDPEVLALRLYSTTTWYDFRELLLRHPSFVGRRGLRAFGKLIKAVGGQADQAAIDGLRRNREMLGRCVEAGVDRAFAELLDHAAGVDTDLAIHALVLEEATDEHRVNDSRGADAVRAAEALVTDPRWPATPVVFRSRTLPLISEALLTDARETAPEIRDAVDEALRRLVAVTRPDEAATAHRVHVQRLLAEARRGDGSVDEAIALLTALLEAEPEASHGGTLTRALLAEAHAIGEDWDEALEHNAVALAEAEEIADAYDGDMVGVVCFRVLARHFRGTGALGSAERAVDLGRRLAGSRTGLRLGAMCDLAMLLRDREHQGDAAEAIGLLTDAVDLAEPEGAFFQRLAFTLLNLLAEPGHHPAPDHPHAELITRLLPWLESRAAGDPEMSLAMSELRVKFARRTGDVEHLRRAREWTAHAPDGVAARLHHLGLLLELHQATGEQRYVDEAGRLLGAASDAGVPVPMLADFAELLRIMARATGDLSYLDQGIDLLDAAPGNVAVLRALAAMLENRGQALERAQDLDRAILLYQDIRDRTDRRSQVYAHREGDVGGALLRRYGLTRDTDDLDAAIGSLRHAVEGDPTAREFGALPNNLAIGLLARHELAGDPADLDEAIDLGEDCIAREPAGSPLLSLWMPNLGRAYLLRHQHTGTDLDRGVAVLRSACQVAVEQGTEGYGAAQIWSRSAGDREAWAEAAEAAELGLDGALALFRRQLTRVHKEATLGSLEELAATGAYAYRRLGDAPAAVDLLERSLSLLLSEQMERGRAELDDLRSAGRGDLADRYLLLSEAVDALERAWAGGTGRDPQRLRQQRADLEAVLGEIRRVPGHEDFLVRRGRGSASARPLVYLSASTWGGSAFIVPSDGDPLPLGLPELTRANVISMIERLLTDGPASAMSELGPRLWREVMEPVLAAVPGDGPLALVPAGLLSLLPLHAACRPDPDRPAGRAYACDLRLITYAPNATALSQAAGRAAATPATSLLAVDNPRPDTAPVHCAQEISAALDRFPEHRHLPGGRATARRVLDTVTGHTVLHFACHAIARLDSPLDSALLLAGEERLTLRAIAQTPMAGRLAVLSACDTAVPGLRLLNESVTLASGFLAAGSAGVIASLWKVPDTATNLLMAAFYRNWEATQDPALALQAAQAWLRDSTNEEKHALFPDVIAPPPGPAGSPIWRLWAGARSHADPVHWAGFALTGY